MMFARCSNPQRSIKELSCTYPTFKKNNKKNKKNIIFMNEWMIKIPI